MSEILRSPTETLMKCMEDFGECEPKELIVIWTDHNGDLCRSSSTNSVSTQLGLIEATKAILVGILMSESE
jgi:hypothetical protein